MASVKQKRALVLLAAGAEEMETVIPVDVLRRSGVRVTLAGLEGSEPVLCSRGIQLVPDQSLEQALRSGLPFDLVLIPGGAEGAKALARSTRVQELLLGQDQAGRLIGAICAGPLALLAAGVLRDRAFTSHPAVAGQLPAGRRDEPVVVDGNLITSQGPGTAVLWALALAEALRGPEMAAKVAEAMRVKGWKGQ